ncbi:uncharacterized protein PG986_003734 [Apiospora aurea]|uniref:Cyanovirin-N domain-containing protein n=1 Tax=Apiospora aurea TaxID=335848 RepID=A0ABR1QT63_9PEZI
MAKISFFLSALLLPLLASLAAAADGGFLDQGCGTMKDPWYYNNGVATTYCAEHVCDSNVETSLNLNLCIGNMNGTLYAKQDGDFGSSCKGCFIEDNYDTLKCLCLNDQKTEWYWTYLHLNSGFIYNWFGYLSCFGYHQSDIPVAYDCQPPGWQPDPNTKDGCNDPSCQGPQADAGHVDLGADAGGDNQPKPTAAPGPEVPSI